MLPQKSSPLLTCSELRGIEAAHGTLPLMERAGAAAASVALSLINRAAPVLVFAGPGNNGGDAFVLARCLHEQHVAVTVVFLGQAERLPPDAHAAYQRWCATGQAVHRQVPDGHYALVVDGLFGIGLTRAATGDYADLIERINAFRASGGPVLALDVPSGLNADTGAMTGSTVSASHTATFLADKPGLHTLDGPDHAGVVSVHSLGLSSPTKHAGALLSCEDFALALRPRQQNSHKGSHGSLAIIGGASGMVGAALLAARAGLYMGAGRLFVGLLDRNRLAVDFLQPELMLRSPEAALAHATAIVAGPGMGLDDVAGALVRRVTATDFPLLLDADALSIVGAQPALADHLHRRHAATVLTPHPAEAARLLGCSTDAVQSDRITAALTLATRYNATVALKGCGTVLARPDGCWRINPTGNPGLATGGTGDVLAGMTGALLAQGWGAWPALCAAVFIHGAAADSLVDAGEGSIGLTASELLRPARHVLNQLIADQLITISELPAS